MENKHTFSKNTELLISLLIALACLFLTVLFPISDSFQGYTKSAFFLLLVPFLFVHFVLRKKISSFGFGLGKIHSGLIWGAGGLIVSLLVFYFLLNYTSFGSIYTSFAITAPDFNSFLLSELIFANLFIFFYGAFFRGFLLFTLLPVIGYWSIVVQAIAYAASAWLSGSSLGLVIAYSVLGVIGGAVSLKSRSFFWAHLMTLAAIILLDAFILRQIHLR